jgi:hypothetical protein
MNSKKIVLINKNGEELTAKQLALLWLRRYQSQYKKVDNKIYRKHLHV